MFWETAGLFLGVGLGEWARYKKLIFVKIMVNSTHFALEFREFTRQTKSAIFSGCESVFYSALNQQ